MDRLGYAVFNSDNTLTHYGQTMDRLGYAVFNSDNTLTHYGQTVDRLWAMQSSTVIIH